MASQPPSEAGAAPGSAPVPPPGSAVVLPHMACSAPGVAQEAQLTAKINRLQTELANALSSKQAGISRELASAAPLAYVLRCCKGGIRFGHILCIAIWPLTKIGISLPIDDSIFPLESVYPAFAHTGWLISKTPSFVSLFPLFLGVGGPAEQRA